MTVTVEIKNPGTLNLLRNLEDMGLIHLQPSGEVPAPNNTAESSHELAKEDKPPYHWLRGCCKNIPGGSVDDFLARSRADKEHELAIEKRQEEERARRAKEKLSS